MDRDRRLLVVHQGALGDTVLGFPVLRLLRDVFARIDLGGSGAVGRLARHLGLVEATLSTESSGFASLYGRPSESILQRIAGYDEVLLFSFSSALAESVRAIIGRERVHRVPPRPAPEAPVHVVPWLLREVRDAGLLPPEGPADPPVSGKASADPDGTRPIVLHPGSGSPMKNWPVGRFLALAARLAAAGRRVEFLAGPAEEKRTETLAASGVPVRTFPELTDLADWLQGTAGLIGNDSGVSHLAGYLGVPTVVLFGPSNPRQWRPWGPAVSVVGPAAGFDCSPCFETGNRACDHRGCLTGISPDAVPCPIRGSDGI